uniref:Uncharacterized protein n=1 Tax=Anguilla anguilla TaxID=7936 RepID=A0A0E9UQK2_ANGAN
MWDRLPKREKENKMPEHVLEIAYSILYSVMLNAMQE